jgi:uncharacterized protein YuzE
MTDERERMRITYDPEVDALGVDLVRNGRSTHTQVLRPNINLDWDRQGRLIGVEILDASAFYPLDQLRQLDDGTEWLTLAEAEAEGAEEGGPTAATLRSLIHKGRIPARKVGRELQIAGHELWNYLENRAPSGRPGRRRTAPKAAASKRKRTSSS